MRCDHDELLEYLAGTLDAGEVERVDRHLLDCDLCWRAVSEDRAGRDLARDAQEAAPANLRERLQLLASLTEPPARRRRRTRAWVGIAAVLAVAILTGTWIAAAPATPTNDVIAAVLAVPDDQTGEFAVDAWTIELQRPALARGHAIVATGDRPFPMPPGAEPVAGVDGAWATTQDGLTIVCVDDPVPQLLIGPAPATELLALRAT